MWLTAIEKFCFIKLAFYFAVFRTHRGTAISRGVLPRITRKSYRASVAQCKVSAYAPSCIDAALRRIGKTRRGGNKIANISGI